MCFRSSFFFSLSPGFDQLDGLGLWHVFAFAEEVVTLVNADWNQTQVIADVVDAALA